MDRRKIDHVDKTLAIDEVDGILRSLMARFGNEVELAVHIARQVGPHVVALSEAMEALHALPPVPR